MNGQFWWFLARSTGITALVMVSASVLWGLFLSSRILQSRRRPAWLLDLHRWLGGLSVLTVGVHIVAIAADSYVQFSPAALLVPGVATWHPVAVAWGIVAFWLLAAVQITSLMMRRLPRKWWHRIHLTSYVVFWAAAIHGAVAGSDSGLPGYRIVAVSLILIVSFATVYRAITSKSANGGRRPGRVRGISEGQAA